MNVNLGEAYAGARLWDSLADAQSALASLQLKFPDVKSVTFQHNDTPFTVDETTDIQALMKAYFEPKGL